MNVTLTPDLEAMVNESVQSGLYRSPSELMCDALQLLKQREELRRLRLEELRGEIQKGIDSLDAGKGIRTTGAELAEEIKRRGRERLAPKETAP